jgi:hypothetical protein
MNERHSTTLKRNEAIIEAGYTLVCKWECDWVEERKTLKLAANPYLYPTESRYRMTISSILNAVMEGRLFGCLEIDIEVPKSEWSNFAQFPPIFKNTTVEYKDIGEHMQNFCNTHNVKFDKRRCLIGSMKGTRMLIITPMIVWYVNHGLNISNVYQVIEFKGSRCFEKFMNMVSNDRRNGK